MTESCSTCRFVKLWKDEDGSVTGVCRRWPHVMNSALADETKMGREYGFQPTVMTNQWCGEYEPVKRESVGLPWMPGDRQRVNRTGLHDPTPAETLLATEGSGRSQKPAVKTIYPPVINHKPRNTPKQRAALACIRKDWNWKG